MEIVLVVASFVIQVFLAWMGIYVALRPPPKEQHRRWIAAFVVACVMGLGIGAYQQYQSVISSRESGKEKNTLTAQIMTLTNAASTQATSDDINRIRSEILDSFDRVIVAIQAKPGSPLPRLTPPVAQPPVPTVENTRLVQKNTTSDRPEFPYGLQVIIQSNVVIQPVSFALECDGEIGDSSFFIAGQAVYMSVQKTIRGNVAEISFNFPSLTPESPLVVTLLSRAQIKVVKAYKTRR